MATKTKNWSTGTGSATIQYGGQGDGEIIVTSDPNSLYEARSMQITIETTNGSPKQTKTITVNQAAKQRIDLSAAVVTAANQTYNGSAKTPTPTVTLNGNTVPNSGYDVSYSNNTNAGTATITITGKGDYTGTANGTFTIAKASRTLSFADTYMVLNTNSTGTKTATPSAGGGDGAITYSLANTTYATINSSTGAVTSKTSDGSVTVTAIIAEGTNYLSASASYTLYVFATTHNYDYNGSYRSVTLPPGTYQFQVWGAQGGVNNTNSSYGINAIQGGKGGYSIGQLSISQAKGIRVYVGGQGSYNAGGYNGGGSSVETSDYNSGDTYGYTKMAGGGGASDIRLSDGSLYSRMIVAGGGSGGAMCYKAVTNESSVTDYTSTGEAPNVYGSRPSRIHLIQDLELTPGVTYTVALNIPSGNDYFIIVEGYKSAGIFGNSDFKNYGNGAVYGSCTFTVNQYKYITVYLMRTDGTNPSKSIPINCTVTHNVSEKTVDRDYQIGYAGGGATGLGYNSTYQGKQNAAGSGGSFGQGANQTVTNYRYCSGAGGGGWYGGGGGQKSNSSMTYVHYSGGGSGFVNTAASAGNRPSGYTGLELDSGTTYAGNTSFPSTGGGTETGHSGNGYVRITRLS